MTNDRRVTAILAEAEIQPDVWATNIRPVEFPDTVNAALSKARLGDRIALVTEYGIGQWPQAMRTLFISPAQLGASLTDGLCPIELFEVIRNYGSDDPKWWALVAVIRKTESSFAAPLKQKIDAPATNIVGRVIDWLAHGREGRPRLVGRY